MTSHYTISGMTCKACAQIVQDTLTNVAGVKEVHVELSTAQAQVAMEYPIRIDTFQTALANSLYQISDGSTTPTAEQESESPKEFSRKNKKLITSYLTAVGHLDYQLLHNYLRPDFTYKGPVSHNSASEFISMIKDHSDSPIAEILLHYDIKAIFTDENECCVIYDSVSRIPGKKEDMTISFVEWITIKDDQIASTEVRFNHRQMLELKQEVTNRGD